MASIISLGFEFRSEYYYVLVTLKELTEKVQYRLTIMNGELEKLMHGFNVINEIDGKLELDDCNGDKKKWELKKQIVQALGEHLHKEILESSHV